MNSAHVFSLSLVGHVSIISITLLSVSSLWRSMCGHHNGCFWKHGCSHVVIAMFTLKWGKQMPHTHDWFEWNRTRVCMRSFRRPRFNQGLFHLFKSHQMSIVICVKWHDSIRTNHDLFGVDYHLHVFLLTRGLIYNWLDLITLMTVSIVLRRTK